MTAQESNIVNAFETTLAAQLASGGSSMNLADDPGVDSPAYFVIDPDNDSNREVVLWASGTDHSAATVTRDLDSKHGTDPTHASGTKVRLAVVKQHFEDVHDRIEDIALTGDVTGTLASATQDVATTIAAGAVDFAMINQGDLITQSETITSNDSDTKIPTTAAVKNYVDAETATLTNKTLGAVTLSGAVTGADQTISAAILKDYAETDADITSAVDLAIDLANGNTGSVTLAHNVDDLHFTNVPTAGFSTFTLIVTQDGTGSRTMDIDAVSVNGGGDVTAKTAGGAGLTLSTAAGSIDILTFLFKDAGTPFLFSQLAFA
tara:strand:- start:93 stop:1052 length:960 start_codon:yes stop_codon:yes gene_type:complete